MTHRVICENQTDEGQKPGKSTLSEHWKCGLFSEDLWHMRRNGQVCGKFAPVHVHTDVTESAAEAKNAHLALTLVIGSH